MKRLRSRRDMLPAVGAPRPNRVLTDCTLILGAWWTPPRRSTRTAGAAVDGCMAHRILAIPLMPSKRTTAPRQAAHCCTEVTRSHDNYRLHQTCKLQFEDCENNNRNCERVPACTTLTNPGGTLLACILHSRVTTSVQKKNFTGGMRVVYRSHVHSTDRTRAAPVQSRYPLPWVASLYHPQCIPRTGPGSTV